MNQKNYLTVGEHENAVNKSWCLSVVPAKPIAQMKIKLNDGKSYNYFSKFLVQENDIAVIGNEMICSENIGNEPCESTGQMGLVKGQATTKLKRGYTADLDFVFTPVVEKTYITACAKYLKVKCDKKTLCAVVVTGVAVAITDECIQLIPVLERDGKVTDVLIDTCGVLCAVLVVYLATRLISKFKFKSTLHSKKNMV